MLEKTYEPSTIESNWYATWETRGYFQPRGAGKPYCIMLPPPNVTGSLHMGHGFQHTLIDALIRYHRMCGENVLWQAGTDHAGIATQMVVERQLLEQNQTRLAVGREKFVAKIWQWKQESGGNITRQLRRLGTSLDWSRERFTLDSGFCQAVNEVFTRLYQQGLIYRGQRLVNWDPHLLTAISDLEVVSEEVQGNLWYIRYPLLDNPEGVIVATTRPETMLGDVAVAVHPTDKRYQHLIGKQLKLPLTERVIPIITDDSIDPEFGTGCVKITPAHDFNDYALGQRHQLPMINIFTVDAHLNENAPLAYRGLERFAARKKIVADLQQQNLLEKIEPHKLKIPRGDRSGTVVEPYLTNQWFMRMQPLAEPAIAAVKTAEFRFVPENWTKTYLQWLENIEDWCISRQLWWGHRIPAWYDAQHNVYVGVDENTVRKQHGLSAQIILCQEEDVLDTWFSAALWPFVTLGWPQQTETFTSFYPTHVLVTGFDIIFFWVARMVMLGLKFTGKVPFKDVYITGLIRDQDGQKMSKSKGNVLDPIDIIDGVDVETLVKKRTSGLMQPAMAEKITKTTRKQFPQGIPAFGTDALRFTYCSLASLTRELRFDLNRVAGYRNFCNKLWNAARFVLMNVRQPLAFPQQLPFSIVDRWIQSRLQKTIRAAHRYFTDYRFDLLAQALYEFTWNEYCDWYLEFTKPVFSNLDTPVPQAQATLYTLLSVLETLLRLLHPVMPYITEEIWQKVAPLLNKTGDTIMLQAYPVADHLILDESAEATVDWLKHVISEIRAVRSEMHINPGARIALLCHEGTEQDKQRVEQYSVWIKNLAKLTSIKWINANEKPAASALALVDTLQLVIPLEGLVDVQAEIQRIEKELAKLEKESQQATSKLSNDQFVANAPPEVVNAVREKLSQTQAALNKLRSQLNFLRAPDVTSQR